MAIVFPNLLRPLSGGYAAAMRSISGGQSLGGIEQVVASASERWAAKFTFNINSTATLFALRAFVMNMRGRTGTVLLPAFDRTRAPWPLDAYGREQSPARLRSRSLDGTPFADSAGFNDRLVDAVLAAPAALRATLVSVQVNKGRAPEPGHFFSIGARLHTVVSVEGANPYSLGIWPPLRADAAALAAVNFSSPACEMRFASDNEGAEALSSMDQMRFSRVTLSFDEAAPVNYSFELREDGGYEFRE